MVPAAIKAAPNSSGTARLKESQRMAAAASGTPTAYSTMPAASQIAKYPVAIAVNETGARLVFKNVGSADGIIMATIIASHMSRKLKPDASQLWPGIRIHIMDMVQPPGIFMSSPMDRQK